jgi:hypothetical protein
MVDMGHDEELQAHLAALTQRYVARGLTPEQAAMAARRQFGNTLQQQDRRELRPFAWIARAAQRAGRRATVAAQPRIHRGRRAGAGPRHRRQQHHLHAAIEATFCVRSRLPQDTIVGTIRRIVAERDAALPIRNVKTVARQLDDTLSAERLIASLSTVFGLIATLMAALGLYGVTAFSVARRTREIGLRTALGASTRTVVWLVLREVLVMVGAGVAIALPCAVLLARYAESQFFGVTPTDAASLAGAGAALAVAALIAGWLPARRASRIAPLAALRHE